jgi:hypothetical protein
MQSIFPNVANNNSEATMSNPFFQTDMTMPNQTETTIPKSNKFPTCTNTSIETGTENIQMCVCPIVPQIQKLEPNSNTWFCQ